MAQTHFYEVDLLWKEGRTGKLSSPVLDETIRCATPPEFPKGVEGLWSPEHLYAASINSCYMATFLAIAENFQLVLKHFSCKTICKLEMYEGRYMITEAVIRPNLLIENMDQEKEKLLKVLEKSKTACLITNSLKTHIVLEPEL